MSTTYDQALTTITENFMNEPDSMEIVAGYLRNMRSGDYEKGFIDVVFQKWERFREYTVEDAVAFMLVHAHLHMGKIAKADIDLGCEPFSDKEIEKNDTALKNGLEKISALGPLPFNPNDPMSERVTCKFSGEFWGGLADEDGFVEWKDNAKFWIFKEGKSDHTTKIAGRRVPLEVGYTMPGRTLAHLRSDRAIARWPHGSKILTILAFVDNDLWNADW